MLATKSWRHNQPIDLRRMTVNPLQNKDIFAATNHISQIQ